MRIPVIATLAAAFLVAPSLASPQQAIPQSQQQTTTPIRSTTRMVQVSVVVHDKHNDPVRGLTKDDFVIYDEKKQRAIQTFSMATNEMPESSPAPLPPNTYTNRVRERNGVPTSITVILLDGLNTQITDQAWARKYVAKFLQQIQPQDRVALYSLGTSLHVLHDFTSDSTSLLAALGQSRPQTPAALDASDAQVSDTGRPMMDIFLNDAYAREANLHLEDRVHRTVNALTLIANHIGTLPGRKNLVWVSGSFPFSVGFDNIEPTTNDARELFADDVETAARALTNANIAVYPVDARGLISGDTGVTSNPANSYNGASPNRAGGPGAARGTFSGPNPSNFDTMLTLADRTGGRAFFNTNDIYGAIRDALNDSRVTYELGFYPDDIKWDGSFHNIKVEVKKPDAHVRARKGYFALPEPKITMEYRQSLIAETATNPLEATGIGIRVQVISTDPGIPRKMKAVVYFDLHDFNFEQKAGISYATVDSVFVQVDDKNAIVDALDQTFHLHLDAATYERLLKEGMTYTKEIPLKDGAINVLVVLRDGTNGNIGDVSVPLSKYFAAHPAVVN